MPELCPRTESIRATASPETAVLKLEPTSSQIANIEKVVSYIREPVSVRVLAFHTAGEAYCDRFAVPGAVDKFCEKMTDIRYVHFCVSIEQDHQTQVYYLLAFMPQSEPSENLSILASELLKVSRWLSLPETTYFIVFRYGRPYSRTDRHWNEVLKQALKKFIPDVRARVRDAPDYPQMNLTVRDIDDAYNRLKVA